MALAWQAFVFTPLDDIKDQRLSKLDLIKGDGKPRISTSSSLILTSNPEQSQTGKLQSCTSRMIDVSIIEFAKVLEPITDPLFNREEITFATIGGMMDCIATCGRETASKRAQGKRQDIDSVAVEPKGIPSVALDTVVDRIVDDEVPLGNEPRSQIVDASCSEGSETLHYDSLLMAGR